MDHLSFWRGVITGVLAGVMIPLVCQYCCRLVFGRGIMRQLQITRLTIKIWRRDRSIRTLKREILRIDCQLAHWGEGPEAK